MCKWPLKQCAVEISGQCDQILKFYHFECTFHLHKVKGYFVWCDIFNFSSLMLMFGLFVFLVKIVSHCLQSKKPLHITREQLGRLLKVY
jgi:hypothetical protein